MTQTPAAPSSTVAPSSTSQSGRIDVLDVLRGIALCGMFVVRFNNYAAAGLETSGGEPSAAVRGLETFIGLFVDGRMYTMFAMLFGLSVTPLMAPVYAIALFAAQAAFSKWWLARYRLGPLEWVWRSVTYWRWQPLRIDPPAVPGVAVPA